ncbi:hypothetical protein MBLNU13_g07911t1 [Cladosporium sp. NU13]
MEGKKIAALDRNGLRHTEDSPDIGNSQLKSTTGKTQGPGRTSGKRQSKARAPRSRDGGRDGPYMELDDDDNNNNRDGGNSGDEGDDERNKGVNEANDQINIDDVEDVEDVRNDNSVASESESESFVETYHDYRSYVRRTTRREAEKEFLRNKRDFVGLPKEHEQNAQQQKDRRFCTWAIRQAKRRTKVLKKEEAARGEDSASDGLSESDGNKMWKMYGIIAEDDARYLIAWKGVDKRTKQDWGDEWTAKENVARKDIREWEAYKRKKAQGEL